MLSRIPLKVRQQLLAHFLLDNLIVKLKHISFEQKGEMSSCTLSVSPIMCKEGMVTFPPAIWQRVNWYFSSGGGGLRLHNGPQYLRTFNACQSAWCAELRDGKPATSTANLGEDIMQMKTHRIYKFSHLKSIFSLPCFCKRQRWAPSEAP